MSQTVIKLGFVPKNRGEYDAAAKYYKDNIVQYEGSSYIADPVGYDPAHPESAYNTGVAPWSEDPQTLNTGWAAFASGNNTFTTGESVDEIGIDDTPTAGSDNLVKSGGLVLSNFELEGKAVYKKVFIENILLEHTKTAFPLKSGKSYVFTLQNDSDMASLFLYKLIGDTPTFLTAITRDTPATITPNQDWDGFALYYNSVVTSATLVHLTIDGESIKDEINSINNNVEEIAEKEIQKISFVDKQQLSDSQKYVACANLGIDSIDGAVVPLSGTDAVNGIQVRNIYTINSLLLSSNKSSVVINSDEKYRITITALPRDITSAYIYLFKNNEQVWRTGVPRVVDEDVIVDGIDADEIGLYATNESSETLSYATIVVKARSKGLAGEVLENNSVPNIFKNKDAYLFKDLFELTAAHIYNRDVFLKAGENYRVKLCGNDSADGIITLYFKDLNDAVVIQKSVFVDSEQILSFASDIYSVTWYIADNITHSGSFSLLIELDGISKDTCDTNFVFGPYKHYIVKGTEQYVHDDIVNNIPVTEGELFYINCDGCRGALGSAYIIIYFYDSHSTLISSSTFKYSKSFVIPENCTKLKISLYPNMGTAGVNTYAVFDNVYVTRSDKANITLRGGFVTEPYPKDYYFESQYISNKINRINGLLKSNYSKGDAFIFITDIHWDLQNAMQSPSLIQYIKEHTGIDKVICGGDTSNGVQRPYFVDNVQRLTNYYRNKITFAVGNHEYLEMTTNGEIANAMERLSDTRKYVGNVGQWYYYYDDDFRHIRYIVLASYDESEAVKQDNPSLSKAATDGYNQTQLDWLENVALNNVPNGYDIITIAHGSLGIGQSHDNNNVVNWSNENAVVAILDAYKSNHSSAHILCLRGHCHRDRILYTAQNIPYVITTCDKNVPWPSESERENPNSPYYQWYPDLDVDRTSGTIHEQAFDVMILNTHTHTLTAVRIGGKARDGVGDNVGNEVEERVVSY